MLLRKGLAIVFLLLVLSPTLPAQSSSIPQLSSNPGAAYTLYLDFGGFSFTGTWGGTFNNGGTPGVTAAYDIDGNSSSFNSTEVANMQNIWSRVAEKYSIMNVNVTTIDPAAAGSSDAQRQAFYDNTAKMMHTVIGGNGNWTGGGGVSYLSTAQNTYNPTNQNGGAGAGLHTNWVFSGQSPRDLQFIGEATAHENGHGLKLDHQSVWSAGAKTDEYSPGTGTGTGSLAPIMGVSYSSERGVWRVGTSSDSASITAQNDLGLMLTNTGIAGTGAGGFRDSGNGHTLATATALPLNNGVIQSSSAKGIITPNSSTPVAIGTANYTKDVFRFDISALSDLSVILRSGRSTITPGVADPGATLRAILQLLDSTGIELFRADTGILTQSLTAKNLNAGTYYLQISSFGGFTDSDGNTYFDVGSYFLTGTLTASPVPEPGLILLFSAVCVTVSWRSLRRSSPEAATAA